MSEVEWNDDEAVVRAAYGVGWEVRSQWLGDYSYDGNYIEVSRLEPSGWSGDEELVSDENWHEIGRSLLQDPAAAWANARKNSADVQAFEALHNPAKQPQPSERSTPGERQDEQEEAAALAMYLDWFLKPDPQPSPVDEACEWYGKPQGQHEFVELDWGKRCIKCKRDYPNPAAEPVDDLGESPIAFWVGPVGPVIYGRDYVRLAKKLIAAEQSLEAEREKSAGLEAELARLRAATDHGLETGGGF